MPESKITNVHIAKVDSRKILLVRVWDLPARIWHWALVFCLTFSVYSGLTGSIALMDWHLKSGYAVIVLLLFRLLWGIWGGSYVRYPIYWRSLKPATPDPQPHTRPGVFMLLALLLLLAVQTGSGLFATDDLFTEGPFNNYVSEDTASTLSWIHNRNFWLIAGLAGIHVCAIGFYGLWRRDPLAQGMSNGRKRLPSSAGESQDHLLRALLSLSAATALVWWLLTYY